jgi:hypothetical protein
MVAGGLDPDFMRLCQEVAQCKNLAFAESSKGTYRCQLNAFLRFGIYFGRCHLPASDLTLKCYVAYLARSLNPSSIARYLNVIHIRHLHAGLPNPLKDNWELAMIRRGIARKLGRPPVQKFFWSACLVCFFGLLRRGMLLPFSVRNSTPVCLIRGDVVNLNLVSFQLCIRHSKTIQFGQRLLTIPFVACADSRICPVAFLIRHLSGSQLQKGVPLFSYLDKGGLCCLTHSVFVSKLKGLLEELGYPSKNYRGHSFRQGCCTMCYQAGLSLPEIKLRGAWKSQAFERYLFIPAESISNSACMIAKFAAAPPE